MRSRYLESSAENRIWIVRPLPTLSALVSMFKANSKRRRLPSLPQHRPAYQIYLTISPEIYKSLPTHRRRRQFSDTHHSAILAAAPTHFAACTPCCCCTCRNKSSQSKVMIGPNSCGSLPRSVKRHPTSAPSGTARRKSAIAERVASLEPPVFFTGHCQEEWPSSVALTRVRSRDWPSYSGSSSDATLLATSVNEDVDTNSSRIVGRTCKVVTRL